MPHFFFFLLLIFGLRPHRIAHDWRTAPISHQKKMCTAIGWYCWPGATHRDRIDCHILSVAAVVLPWPNQCD